MKITESKIVNFGKQVALGITILIVGFLLFANQAYADNLALSGYAWSDLPQAGVRGAGWISFSGNTGSGGTYGVFINPDTGIMSGYAWSENYGWLSFNDSTYGGNNDLANCPVSPCQAKVNSPVGGVSTVTGWAKFTNGSQAGSYEGWVRLSNSVSPSYGVTATYNPTTRLLEFSGYAWGSDFIGWISFKGPGQPPTYQVVANSTTGTLSVTTCTIPDGSSTCVAQVTWTTTNRVPGANTAVTRNNPDGTTVSTATSGTNVNNTVNHGRSSYFLYHNGNKLAEKYIDVVCASGENNWNINDKVCKPTTFMTGTLGPTVPGNTSCTILNGANSCTINFSWNVTLPDIVGGSAVTSPIKNDGTPGNNTIVATGDSGTNSPFVVPYNTRTFYLYNNGVGLANSTVTSSCVSGSPWNGSVCGSGFVWSTWSECSAQCGPGTQTRHCIGGTSCVGPSFQTCNGSSCPSLPDLVADNPTPNGTTVNTLTTFSSTIYNIGTASTGIPFNNFFQITTAADGGGSLLPDFSPVQMPSLIFGGSNTTTTTYTFPGIGTYSVRACADKSDRNDINGAVPESNENNNCSDWVNVEVAPGPTCADPEATNYNGPLPCTFPQVCEDPKANNFHGSLSCTYDIGVSCDDPDANNYLSGPLPCNYGSIVIGAYPMSIYKGDSAILKWHAPSSNSYCAGTNFNTGGALSGSISISPVVTTIYTITCTSGNASVQVTVKKNPKYREN